MVCFVLSVSVSTASTTYNYRVSFEYDTVGEFFKTIILSLYFADQDSLYWCEDDEGNVLIGNRHSGEPFFWVNPGDKTAYFLSSRTKKVSELKPAQEKIIFEIYDMLDTDKILDLDEFEFDYATKDRVWSGCFTAGKKGVFTEGSGGKKYPCRKIRGTLTPSDSDDVTPITIYLGTGGLLKNHVVRLEFDYPRWPKVKVTIRSVEEE
ncbi:MAG: hypothetical protein GY771_14645 [bacterium]|nr:hypothetical protein [bacterium]